MQHVKLRQPQWWVWSAITVALICGLAGATPGMGLALAVCAAQAAVYLGRQRDLMHFPTQLRVAYLLLLASGFLPGVAFMHWLLAIGTASLVLTGYCPLARLLILFPWNRTVPLTLRRIAVIALHPPIQGSVRGGLPL